MRRLSPLVPGLLLLITPFSAETAPPAQVEAVIDRSLAAMGGRETLVQLKSLSLQTRTVSYRLDDSERHDAAPWIDVVDGTEMRDEVGGRVRLDSTDRSAQWTLETQAFEAGGVSLSGFNWQGSRKWTAKPSLGERLALSPERLLLLAEAAPDVRLLSPAKVSGDLNDVIGFSWKGFPVRVFIDSNSHLPRRMEIRRADPREGISVMLGDIDWSTDYLFYRREPNGLVYPWQQNSYRDGKPWQTLVIVGLQQNPQFPSGTFDLPPDAVTARSKFVDEPYADRPIRVPASGDPLVQVADNVWQVEGNWNVLVVRQPDGLVVVEAPQSGGYSSKVMQLLADRFPQSPIKVLVSTTDTTFHYAGLRAYVARGVPIYALSANVPLLQQFTARRRTFVPDELSRHPRSPIFKPVAAPVIIGKGSERIELYPIGGSGDARMMMAYLPAKHLLYGSSNDLNADQQRVTFNMFELVRKIDAMDLPVSDFVAIHTSKTPWPTIRRLALEAPPISSD